MGLDRLLEPNTIKIKKSDIAAMVKFDKSIVPSLKSFLQMKDPEPYKLPASQIKINDFDAIIEDLDKDIDIEAMGTKLKDVTSEEGSVFLTTYMHMINMLQQGRPPVSTIGVMGIEPSEPSDEEKTEFIWLCRMVNDVNWIFTLMRTNQLTQSEVELFQQTYPDTYDEIMLALTTLLVESSQEAVTGFQSKWQLSVLAALAMAPEVTQSVLGALQSTYLDEDEEPSTPSSSTSFNQSQGLTESQKIEEA